MNRQSIPLQIIESRSSVSPPDARAAASCCTGEPGRRAIKIALLILVLLGFGLRIGAIIALRSWERPSAMEHRSIAVNLVERGVFWFGDFGYYGPSSVQSPPYPFLLTVLFYIFGSDTPAAYAAAMVINAMAGGLTVWLTYMLARTLGGSARVGLLAAAGFAAWPSQIYCVTFVQAIALITAALTAIIILFYRSVRTGRLAPWIGFSLIGTLAALTEPVFLPVMAFTGLMILFWRNLPMKARIRNAAVLLAAAAVVIGPWTVRNRVVHGQWIPIKSTTWVNIWKGNNNYATGTDRLPISPEYRGRLWKNLFSLNDAQMRDTPADSARQYDMLTPEQLARLKGQTEAAREDIFKQWATSWIGDNPGEYFKLALIRLGKTIWIDWDNPKSYNIINILPRAALLVLTAAGLVVAYRRKWSLLFPGLVVGSCLLVYALTIAAARFSLPFEPLQLCLAAGFLATAIGLNRDHKMNLAPAIDKMTA